MRDFTYSSTFVPELAAEYLLRWIAEMGLQPGDPLPTEHELTQALELESGAVHGAVALLTEHGILSTDDTGTRLAILPPQLKNPLGLCCAAEPAKLSQDWGILRLILEPAVAELAAIYSTPEDLQRLTYWHDRIDAEIAQGAPQMESDLEFHRAITNATHNVVIENLMPLIAAGINQFVATAQNSAFTDSREYHQDVYYAIRHHDGSAARHAMESLLCLNQTQLNELRRQADRAKADVRKD